MTRHTMARRNERFLVLGLVAAFALSGCASSVRSSAPAPTPTATMILPSPTASPATPKPSATRVLSTPSPPVWTSVVYPYSLELPPGTARRNWSGASRQWDGDELVGTETPELTDIQSTPDGSLFVFGTPWDGTVEEFRDHVLQAMRRYHGCGAPEEEVAFELAGAPAIALRQTCERGPRAAPAIAVHSGFGLVIRLLDVPPDKEAVVLDDLQTWLQGLTWTN